MNLRSKFLPVSMEIFFMQNFVVILISSCTSLQECATQANFNSSVAKSDFGGMCKEKSIHKTKLPLVLSLTRCVNLGKYLLFLPKIL